MIRIKTAGSEPLINVANIALVEPARVQIIPPGAASWGDKDRVPGTRICLLNGEEIESIEDPEEIFTKIEREGKA